MTPRLEGLFASPQHYEKYKARLDKKLAEFRFGFMSDAKWRKLFSAICAEGSPARQCEIYDFFGSCVNEIRFALPAADYAQGICENYISQRLTTSEKPTLRRDRIHRICKILRLRKPRRTATARAQKPGP